MLKENRVVKSLSRIPLMLIAFCLVFGYYNGRCNEKSSDLVLDISNVAKLPPPKEITINNGKVKVLKYKLISQDQQVKTIKCDAKKMPHEVKGEFITIILYEEYYGKERNYLCEMETQKFTFPFLNVSVKDFPYKETELSAQPSKVFPSKKDLDRIAKEQAILNKVYSKSADSFLFQTIFKLPLDSERTSIYGDRRIFNKAKPSTHLGNDFRAKEGTEIKATNDGVVVFIGELFYSGKTVIVDHGHYLFSMYGHLSEIGVKKGAKVKNGEILGKSGATGRVSGPHLHWGVKINGDWIDGYSLVEEYSSVVKN